MYIRYDAITPYVTKSYISYTVLPLFSFSNVSESRQVSFKDSKVHKGFLSLRREAVQSFAVKQCCWDPGSRTSPVPATVSYYCLKQKIFLKAACDVITSFSVRSTGKISHESVKVAQESSPLLSPSEYSAWVIDSGPDMQTQWIAKKGKKAKLSSHVMFAIAEHWIRQASRINSIH